VLFPHLSLNLGLDFIIYGLEAIAAEEERLYSGVVEVVSYLVGCCVVVQLNVNKVKKVERIVGFTFRLFV